MIFILHCTGFIQAERLRMHLVIHTGEKKYPCPIPNCGKFFALNQYVTNHIRDTHEKRRRNRNPKQAPTTMVDEETITTAADGETTTIIGTTVNPDNNEVLKTKSDRSSIPVEVAEVVVPEYSHEETMTDENNYSGEIVVFRL